MQATIHARHVHEQRELNVAGPPGFEPRKKVLETSMIPFHHDPSVGICPSVHILPVRKAQGKPLILKVHNRLTHTDYV